MLAIVRKSITKDLIFTSLAQLWRLISGPITLIFIPIFLNQEQQGYWYTFSSLAAMSILADLGFSTIILQFAAHEFAFLKFDGTTITGENEHLDKLATFFRFSLRWVLSISLAAFPIIFGVGYYVLANKPTHIIWSIPWLVYMLGSAITFINGTLLYFFEGCDLVGKVQRIRLYIAIMTSITVWTGLVLKVDLYALALSLLISGLFSSFLIIKNFGPVISFLLGVARNSNYSWKQEFFSLLWRYAISWASGYFIFQIYTPVMFHFHGAAEAGKIGLSMALWSAIFSISNTWIYAIQPKLNIAISQKNWQELDGLFFKNMLFSLATFLIGAMVAIGLLIGLQGKLPIIERFTSITSMILLGASWFMQLVVNSLAVYLRAHKEEPLVVSSVVTAIYIVLVTLVVAKFLPREYFFLGYVSSYFFGLPWVIHIFNLKRKALHGNAAS